MQTYIEQIIGRYVYNFDPVTGEMIQGISGLDWEYIVRAILLIIGIIFIFRIVMSFLYRWSK